jgi:hypothetical protein
MKIAFFSTHVMWHRHFETELEIMQSHLDELGADGNEVHEYVCDQRMLSCDVLTAYWGKSRVKRRPIDYAAARKSICTRCIKTRKKGVSLLDGLRIERPIVSSPPPAVQFKYDTLEDLKAIQVEEYFLGRCVASTIISAKRDVQPDVQELRSVIDDCIRSALHLYYSTKENLKREKYDLAYIFNGRFAHTHALVAACRAVGVEYFTYELGCDQNHYGLFHNSTPHDLMEMERRIDEHWSAEGDEMKRTRIGSQFFTERVQGTEQGWFSFTKSQTKSLLPREWDPAKTNLVIFTSSDDEFEAVEVDDWKNPIYRDQVDAITSIVSDKRIRQSPELRIYIRIHPNQSFLSNQQTQALLALNSRRVVVIPAESAISSYAMLLGCAKVLSFGSTVGIEATYWGKPSILAGVAPFRSHNVTYNPRTHSQVIDLLLAELPPKSRDNTLKYGYYCKTFGVRYRYFEPKSLLHGTFKGTNLEIYRDSFVRGSLKILFPRVRRSALVQRCILAAHWVVTRAKKSWVYARAD